MKIRCVCSRVLVPRPGFRAEAGQTVQVRCPCGRRPRTVVTEVNACTLVARSIAARLEAQARMWGKLAEAVRQSCADPSPQSGAGT